MTNAAMPVLPGCPPLWWRDPLQTARQVEMAARLLACGASRRPDRMTDLLLDGPHGALRVEPVVWMRKCWHLHMALCWPPGCEAAWWCRVLLAANAQLMRQASLAFAVDEAGQPVLVGRLYAGADREVGIAQQLHGALEVGASADSVARVAGVAPVLYEALPSFIAAHDHAAGGGEESDPPLLEVLVELGVPTREACHVAATGRIDAGEGEVRVESGDAGRTLLLSAHLGHAVLDGEGLSALRLNASLMQGHGLAIAHGAQGHRVLAHWPWQGRQRSEFEDCLAVLAGLPATLRDECITHAAADADFSGLMPL